MGVTVKQLIDRLTLSRLISPEEIETFRAETGGTAEDLARALVRVGKLTKYQVKEVWQGHYDKLVLGEYVILDEIGAGGMGKVLKAQHRRMERIVALKVLSAKLVDSPEAIKRFQREVKAAARLEHPNIVTAYDAGESNGMHFLVMQYVRGTDLAGIMKQKGLFTVEQAVDCTIQAARGRRVEQDTGVFARITAVINGPWRLHLAIGGLGALLVVAASTATFVARDSDQAVQRTADSGNLAPAEVKATSLPSGPIGSRESRETSVAELMGNGTANTGMEASSTDWLRDWLTGWSEPANLGPTVNSATNEWSPSLTADGLTLLFSSERPGGQGNVDIWMCTRTSKTSSFGRAINLGPVVNTSSHDGTPSLCSNSLILLFCSDRPGGEGALDVWACSRQSTNSPFGRPNNLGAPINSSDDDSTAVLSADGSLLLLRSRRPGGAGNSDIWMCTRRSPVEAPTDPNQADQPPLAIAPFDASQAKKHQQAWADYLGVPVEQEVDLGDGVTLTMVLIPPGEFVMGSSVEEQARFLEEAKAAGDQWAVDRIPAEGPQHRVRINRAFRLGHHEVTVGQFRHFVEETAYKTDAERDGKGGRGFVDGQEVQDARLVWNTDPGFEQTDEHPVMNVSWNDAMAFCEWLTKKELADYILPSEAQWEYACRAGTTTAWYCGDSDGRLEEYAWFNRNAGGKTHPVGQLKSNGWGLHDMYGNVRERCADHWATDDYAQSPPNDPSGPPSGSNRVVRGGYWKNHAGGCRSAARTAASPEGRNSGLGFRVASVLADK